MNDGSNARQQIVEKIKNSANILVTVSSNPSVDELSAAIGLTSMLNGIKKHATAVVSSNVPPAITFLEPSKTFENTVDSLRDFIIALDKEKADHLRYKVEGDVVKIFITPYRTTITSDDLDFSQGDYNVELVLALGVKDQDSLDKALQAHGKILHDATVATVSCGSTPSKLGSIDWFDPNASSLSEMLVSLSESVRVDGPVLDEQIATAFLTGIVAATDRFSNNRTSSKVMTMAAQLMAAGANQQLIAAKLEEAHEIKSSDSPEPSQNDESDSSDDQSDGMTEMNEGESAALPKHASKSKKKKTDDGELAINHEKEGSLDEVAEQTANENQQEAAKTAEEELEHQLSQVAPAASAKPSVSDLQKDLASASAEVEEAAKTDPVPESVLPPVAPVSDVHDQQNVSDEPSLGGTLNATAEQASEDARREEDQSRNKTILSHGDNRYVGDEKPTFQAPINAANDDSNTPQSVDIFKDETLATSQAASVQPPADTLADLDRKNRDDHTEARSAVELAYEAAPIPTPMSQPSSEPVFESPAQEPAPAVVEAVQQNQSSVSPAPFAPPQVELPPVPAPIDFSQLPPPPPLPPMNAPQGALPPEQLGQIFGTPPQQEQAPSEQQSQPAPNDPNQFKIPGQ